MLPFTKEQFLLVFSDYNQGIWPTQVVAYVVGIAIVIVAHRPAAMSDRIVSAGLATMWIWTGIAYHWVYFSAINQAAFAFGALFIVQGVLLWYVGVMHGTVSFDARTRGWRRWLGWSLIAYSAVLYPLLGIAMGQSYPSMPMFGITPCPVTLFTLGLLLITSTRIAWWLLAVPFVWTLVGGSAALLLEMPQDWLLLLSGILVLPILLRGPRGLRSAVA